MSSKKKGGFKKGDPKPKGSGRKAGTPNKKTEEFHNAVAEQIAASGSDDPVEVMTAIMMAPMPKAEDYEGEPVAYVMALKSWAALRFEAAKQLAPFKHPKLAAIDIRVDASKEAQDIIRATMIKEQGGPKDES